MTPLSTGASERAGGVRAAGSHRWWWMPCSIAALVVLVVGVALTGALAGLASAVNQHEEGQLLHLQVQEAGTLLAQIVPSAETPLVSAAEVAVATDGSARAFSDSVEHGQAQPSRFSSVTLWHLGTDGPVQVARVGARPDMVTSSASVHRLVDQAQQSPRVQVAGLFTPSGAQLAFAYSPPGTHAWAVYAQSRRIFDRHFDVPASSPYANLSLAVYLGRGSARQALLGTSAPHLPLAGTTAEEVVPFGASALTLVAAPAHELTGALSSNLPWIVVGAGLIITVVSFVITELLVRRRRSAESLAEENRRLYRQQRGIALSLQQGLLPRSLPEITGMEIAARYVAGAVGTEIGGDWYDVVEQSPGSFLFAVGDVSGRGVRAATVMARLHFAIRAHAADGDGPIQILHKLSNLLEVNADDHFATVLCGTVDVTQRTLTVASAGHLPPMIVTGDRHRYVDVPVGPPVGVVDDADYQAVTVWLPPGSLLLAFTDGLVEQPAEGVAAGLERLAADVRVRQGSLGGSLDALIAQVAGPDPTDDTVVLGMRWTDDELVTARSGDRVDQAEPVSERR